MNPQIRKYQTLGDTLMIVAIAFLIAGFVAGFVYDDHLSIAIQIAGHVVIIFGGLLLKLGYVLRIASQHAAGMAAA